MRAATTTAGARAMGGTSPAGSWESPDAMRIGRTIPSLPPTLHHRWTSPSSGAGIDRLALVASFIWLVAAINGWIGPRVNVIEIDGTALDWIRSDPHRVKRDRPTYRHPTRETMPRLPVRRDVGLRRPDSFGTAAVQRHAIESSFVMASKRPFASWAK